jgi:transcriptional regulator with XRE-family HTH domain
VFYDNYLKICEERGVAPTRVLVDLGISKSAISNWKNGGEPSNRTKKAIADYFGITVRQLMSGEIENAPAPEQSEDDELDEILEEARRNPDLKMLFSLSSKATPEEVKKYIQIIKLMCGDDNGASDN